MQWHILCCTIKAVVLAQQINTGCFASHFALLRKTQTDAKTQIDLAHEILGKGQVVTYKLLHLPNMALMEGLPLQPSIPILPALLLAPPIVLSSNSYKAMCPR